MAAKNAIIVKKEYEQALLSAAISTGVILKKANQTRKGYALYLLVVFRYQTIFELGYNFSQITGQRL